MSDTGSMVERVARAICREECEYPGITYSVWDASLSDMDRKKYLALARAAILAMEEPTKDMIDAAWRVTERVPASERMSVLLKDSRTAHSVKMLNRFRAMIRKAAEG